MMKNKLMGSTKLGMLTSGAGAKRKEEKEKKRKEKSMIENKQSYMHTHK